MLHRTDHNSGKLTIPWTLHVTTSRHPTTLVSHRQTGPTVHGTPAEYLVYSPSQSILILVGTRDGWYSTPPLRHESPAIPPVTLHANTRLPSRCRSDTLPPQGVGGVYGIPGERVHTSPHPGRDDCRSNKQPQQCQHSGAGYSRWRRRTTATTKVDNLNSPAGNTHRAEQSPTEATHPHGQIPTCSQPDTTLLT